MRTRLFMLLILLTPSLFAQEVDLKKGLVANYPLDGKTVDLTGKHKNGKISNAVATKGRNGKDGGAFAFKAKFESTITLPVNAGPDKMPVVTITAWIQPRNSAGSMPVISCGGSNENRALYLDYFDNVNHWVMQCGSDGEIKGPAMLSQKWIFVALMYDGKFKEARLLVGDELFKSPAFFRGGNEDLVIGRFNGDIDEVRVYDRFLTLAELESLSGKKINATQEDLTTVDRFAYRKEREKEEAAEVKPGDVFIVNSTEFVVKDSAGGWGQKALLKEGDTVRVDSVIGDNLRIVYARGEMGFVHRGTLLQNAYLEGGTSIGHSTKMTLKHIFDFTSLRSWIIVVICALILFAAKKRFILIDELLNKLRKKDIYSSGGSKSGAMAVKETFLDKIFPIDSMRWWPIIPGFLFGFCLFAGLLFNAGETEWFFAQGFKIIPTGFTRWIHWMLYSMEWVMFISLIMIALESYVVTGPLIMWLRIIIILILNLMSFVVAIYLSIIVLIIAVVMLVLFMLSSAGSSKYKCPHCGRTFTASGTSGDCPHCGGGWSA